MNLNIYLNPGLGLRKHEGNEDGEGEGEVVNLQSECKHCLEIRGTLEGHS